MHTPPSMVVFGSLGQVLKQDQLQQLKRALKRDKSLFQPITAALLGLDSVWDSLLENDSDLSVLDETGRLISRTFARFVADGAGTEVHDGDGFDLARHTDQWSKNNMVAMPMTILNHIVQYQDYLQCSGLSHESLLESVSRSGAGIQGFCAGLLSAIAVSRASTIGEVMVSAAKSIHLAFSVGAYVDADMARSGKIYKSVAVRWRSPGNLAGVQEILDKYPDSYLAITRDDHDMTITARATSLLELQHDLTLHGASFLDIGLTGRYHSSVHKYAPQKIVVASRELLDAHSGHRTLVLANADSKLIQPGSDGVLMLLKSILVDHANWHQTVLTATSGLRGLEKKPSVIVFGSDAINKSDFRAFSVVRWTLTGSSGSSRSAPSIMGPSNPATGCSSGPSPETGSKESSTPGRDNSPYPSDSIAVVGMACKFPGAESIDEFWSLLVNGESMLSQIPPNRFGDKGEENDPGSWRTPAGLKFWGNFVDEIEAFDHKFFKKSAREAASMDPQQRLLLQVAYQALASSHYFSAPASARETDIGVYIGSCSSDYDSIVGSHMPTAYATTGTLRAFLSGRISHHFGLTGPSLVFDTACSSSAVAIHTACKALQTGECAQALAGGVTLITSPYLYENLAAAHFLSPSGATKPFDAAADGYCRGEGIGLVVLKKLSVALRDGDTVLGVIAGSAVNQNSNNVSITVPHSPSQSTLYQRVLRQAGVRPEKVTFVEAHGTGTPVGDPIEMESLRQVFGGTKRNGSSIPLFVSSVKGNIGHLEGASGVAGLIKALLQMEHRTACQQASFSKLNPRIPCLEQDHLCVPTSNRALNRPGDGGILTACVNNYGAAGSNAALMLMGPPPKVNKLNYQVEASDDVKFPIRITAASMTSLIRYCNTLDIHLKSLLATVTSSTSGQLLANVAFSLSLQQNPELAHALTLTASRDINNLRHSLSVALEAHEQDGEVNREQPIGPLPVVLCFGGQVGQHVGLSKQLWSQCDLLRAHLDACDAHLQSMGHPSIYPFIFEMSPIEDVVVLQTAIFASQYACARAWLNTGLEVDCVIGHSLGQLAALCVSGILSLRDGLRLVAGRAALMKTHWGPEPGSMIAVEAEKQVLLRLMSHLTEADPSHRFEVACYNGPTSQVVVGDKTSIDALASVFEESGLRHRRLQVSHGFHSRFTDPLMPYLETLAEELVLGQATIPLETCTEDESWGGRPTARLIAAHTRDPVFFSQAAGRIRDRLGACTFVEAGGDSGIMGMMRRAVDQNRTGTRSVAPPGPGAGGNDSFVAMELRGQAAVGKLAEVTVKLWDSGYRALGFWPFHRRHAGDGYEVMRLPPYQFEKTKHWLGRPPGACQPEPPRALVQPSVKAKTDDAEGGYVRVDALAQAPAALPPPVMSNTQAILLDLCAILENIAGIPSKEVRGNLSFDDLGVDSLMMIEFIGETSSLYKVHLPIQDLEQLTELNSLVRYLDGHGCRGGNTASGETRSSPISFTSVIEEDTPLSSSIMSSTAGEDDITGKATGPEEHARINGASDGKQQPQGRAEGHTIVSEYPSTAPTGSAQKTFNDHRMDVDLYNEQTKFKGFWESVYPDQARLVQAYIVEAFCDMGVDLANLAAGEQLPLFQAKVLTKHASLMKRLHKILLDDGLISACASTQESDVDVSESSFTRTSKPIDPTPAATLLQLMLDKFPQHSSETMLMDVTGSVLADCLTGKVDPLRLLFANRANRAVMADVYEKAPMCQATTRFLADFMSSTFKPDLSSSNGDSSSTRVIRILEVGGGTGGTAKYLVDHLIRQGSNFVYRFTDISSSLVAQARNGIFADKHNVMEFATLDCDTTPPPELCGKFDVVVATNCIHATRNAVSTAANMASMLRPDGVFCLVEFTRGLYWFDLVYGLLEGWWAFDDGRTHALADQWFWERSLKAAGFGHVAWTDGASAEAQTMRVISGFLTAPEDDSFRPLPRGLVKKAGLPVETFTWKRVGSLELKADVYYPKTADEPGRTRTVALMIHGGGHLLFSRRDIPMKHVRMLLQRGFLPVSVDYRLCPEVSLFDGPVTDCRDALRWVRETLPSLPLSWPNVRVLPDGKVLALGWSSGGQLAMTLGFTAEPAGIKPPDVILPFYSPSDLEAEFWDKPIYPAAAEEPPQKTWGLLDCVHDEPILEYTPISNKRTTGLSLTLKDDRARLILHMNWAAQSVAVLVRGLPSKSAAATMTDTDWASLERPAPEDVRRCSPYWHIVHGDYTTPTFMVHGNVDDWIPYQMTQRTVAALRARGVPCGVLIPDQCGHAFDLFPSEDHLGLGWAAIDAAYDFACEQLSFGLSRGA